MEALSTETASGAQSTTQNPQGNDASSSASGGLNRVQPGASANSLDATPAEENAVQLKTQQGSSIQLQATSQASRGQSSPRVGTNTDFAPVSILLFIVAAVLLISTFTRSKNTTD